MALTVVYDACVLYPSTLRDLLIRLAQADLVRARWTDQILDEVFNNLKEDRPDLEPAKLGRTRRLMVAAVRDCLVQRYEPLVAGLQLPDEKDRHVLAAAIKARAQAIVTTNLRDFPADALHVWGVEPQHPDQFVIDQINANGPTVYGAVQRIADSSKRPPRTVDDVLTALEKNGLAESALVLRRWAWL